MPTTSVAMGAEQIMGRGQHSSTSDRVKDATLHNEVCTVVRKGEEAEDDFSPDLLASAVIVQRDTDCSWSSVIAVL